MLSWLGAVICLAEVNLASLDQVLLLDLLRKASVTPPPLPPTSTLASVAMQVTANIVFLVTLKCKLASCMPACGPVFLTATCNFLFITS